MPNEGENILPWAIWGWKYFTMCYLLQWNAIPVKKPFILASSTTVECQQHLDERYSVTLQCWVLPNELVGRIIRKTICKVNQTTKYYCTHPFLFTKIQTTAAIAQFQTITSCCHAFINCNHDHGKSHTHQNSYIFSKHYLRCKNIAEKFEIVKI